MKKIFLFGLSCIKILAAEPDSPALFPHKFTYEVEYNATKPLSVRLMGDFNGGSATATPMKEIKPGVYETDLNLPEGIYQYKFFLETKKNAFAITPNHSESDRSLEDPDEWGKYDHAAFYSGYDTKDFPSNIQSIKEIPLKSILHQGEKLADFSFLTPSLARINCRVANGLANSLILHYLHKDSWQTVNMEKVGGIGGWDQFSATLQGLTGGDILYYFELSSDFGVLYVGDGVLNSLLESAQKSAFKQPLQMNPWVANWGADAIWYEIFPDRFRKGTLNKNVKKWTDWPIGINPNDETIFLKPGQTSPLKNRDELISKNKAAINEISYGGDLLGMIEALPYLKNLGVNALYLTPVFVGRQVHHYHTLDMRHIDDAFGVDGSYLKIEGEQDDPATWKWSESDQLFLDFIAKAHALGFKVVIDLNLHSLHKESKWFQDVLKNRQSSKYANWFEIYNWGEGPGSDIGYTSWDDWIGGNLMPRFKVTENLNYPDSLKIFLFAALLRWLAPDGISSKGVDGFRIDSPRTVPINFLWEMRNLVKKTKPQAILIAENWHSSYRWNQQLLFDGLQDMEWTENIFNAFIGGDKQFSNYENYLNRLFNFGSISNVMLSWHLLDDHDTMRFISSIGNSPKGQFHPGQDPYPYIRSPNPLDWDRFYQVVTFQFLTFGAPLIYYGDELGMWSGNDPYNRAPMLWDDIQGWSAQNLKILQFYKKIINLRKTLEPLRRGNFTPLSVKEENVLAFIRTLNGQRVVAVTNRSSDQKKIILSLPKNEKISTFVDFLDPDQVDWNPTQEFLIRNPSLGYPLKEGQIEVLIPPWKTRVLVETTKLLP